MTVTVGDLRKLYDRRLVAAAAGPVLESFRRQHADLVAAAAGPVLESFRRQHADLVAAAAGPVLESFRRQHSLIANYLAAAAAQAAIDLRLLQDAEISHQPAVDWVNVAQLMIRVIVATLVIYMIEAAWQEGKDNAPATTLLQLLGALVLWYQVDGWIWGRFPRE
jgi:hypothetical protein